jgi:hypothetical protein
MMGESWFVARFTVPDLIQSRSLPAVSFSGLDGVKTTHMPKQQIGLTETLSAVPSPGEPAIEESIWTNPRRHSAQSPISLSTTAAAA